MTGGFHLAPKPERRAPKPRSRLKVKSRDYDTGWKLAKDRVKLRDGNRCKIPGCQRRDIDVHHITPWSVVRIHEDHNLICLCRRHHDLVGEKIEYRATLYDLIKTPTELRGGRFEHPRRRNNGLDEAA